MPYLRPLPAPLRPRWRRAAAALLLCAALPALGASLRLCVDEQLHPPYLLASGGGAVPQLLAMAAARAGLTISLHRAPIQRCLVEIRNGLADGYPVGSSLPALVAEFAYPLAKGQVDPARATMRARMAVFRRSGDSADWDGKQFLNLRAPVLAPSNLMLVREGVRALKAPLDDSAGSMALNFHKLLAGRGDLVIGFENDGAQLLRLHAFSGRIEALALPFNDAYYYLAVSQAYYTTHRAQMEALWDAIGHGRNAPAYLDALRAP